LGDFAIFLQSFWFCGLTIHQSIEIEFESPLRQVSIASGVVTH